jgi:hypothetical protein
MSCTLRMLDTAAMEERLRSELSEAREALDAVCTKRAELERLCKGDGTMSDGTVTLLEMQQLHWLAARRYRLALRRFTLIVVDGKVEGDVPLR